MGSLSHHAIVVTSWDENQLKKAHSKAKEIFSNVFTDDFHVLDGSKIVTPIFDGVVNSQ